MELSLHRLRMLYEFSRCGTVTETATILHYTPSAVSQQLAVLEREVGLELLEQVGRRLRLTEVGRVLATHAGEVLAAERRARIAVEQAQKTLQAELTVGVLATLASSLVPPALARLAERHPGIRVKTREVPPEQMQTAVREGELDLAFVLDYPDAPTAWDASVVSTPICVEQLRLVTPPGALDSAEPVDLAEFADFSWVASEANTQFGHALRMVCQRAGFVPHIAHQVDEQATAMAMVAAGLGVTLVADLGLSLRPAAVDIVPLRDPMTRRVLVVRRQATGDRPSECAFVRATLDAAADFGLTPDTDAAATSWTPPPAERFGPGTTSGSGTVDPIHVV
ncbi:LysR family transcriptional regulator [Spiractinospora alimapuensis]|uniref:LysR family transcriptional regulator n=1 Tax=Spiractinospora alimapuensis TaxID=2820884 RepID=UPI001F2B8470|nr:LysR family transcriptional regulator [Spiractinospora alimapuensis]QVQ50743.1 LysR family transcriptional regulator [Spiractinospora alimapuensis]